MKRLRFSTKSTRWAAFALALLLALLCGAAAPLRAGDPFEPYTPVPTPEAPYTALDAEQYQALDGDLQHYLDPRYTDMPKATLQFRFTEDTLTLSVGSYGTGSGVFFQGPCSSRGRGTVDAQVRLSGMDIPPDQQVVSIRVLLHATTEPDIYIVTLKEPANPDKYFQTAFSEIYDVSLAYLKT